MSIIIPLTTINTIQSKYRNCRRNYRDTSLGRLALRQSWGFGVPKVGALFFKRLWRHKWSFALNCLYFWLFWVLLHVGFLCLWQTGVTPCCSARAARCGGFSCCRAQALGALGCSSCGLQVLNAGSVVRAHGRSCSMACGVFPAQELSWYPLHLQVDW